MIGHSVGEYVAATLAGVMTLEDALRLIARRGAADLRAAARIDAGGDGARRTRLESFRRRRGVARGDQRSGLRRCCPDPTTRSIGSKRRYARDAVAARRLHTSHAFHSSMMDPILREFEDRRRWRSAVAAVDSVCGHTDRRVGGRRRDATRVLERATAVDRPLRRRRPHRRRGRGPAGKHPAFLEVGPGNTLVTFAGETARNGGPPPPCLTSLPGPHDRRIGYRSDARVAGTTLGEWSRRRLARVPSHGTAARASACRRIRSSGAVTGSARDRAQSAERAEAARHVELVPPLRCGARSRRSRTTPTLAGRRVLVFDEETGLGAAVADRLPRGRTRSRSSSAQARRSSAINDRRLHPRPGAARGLQATRDEGLRDARIGLAGVIDCWSAAPPAATDLDAAGAITLARADAARACA